MKKRTVQAGRPKGTTTFDASVALAFGMAVRQARTEAGFAQEGFAYAAGIERSYMGKIERGQHLPSLPLIVRIAKALDCSTADLMLGMEAHLESE